MDITPSWNYMASSLSDFHETVLLEEHLWIGYASELSSGDCMGDEGDALIPLFDTNNERTMLEARDGKPLVVDFGVNIAVEKN